MKNTKLIAALILSLFATTSSYAADRCAGQVSTSTLQAEAVSNFYFDMKFHELVCTYVLKGAALKLVEDKVLAARTLVKPNIIAAQDKIVAHLGSEGAFETYYARVGNHMSYLNLPNPCQRASAIADMIVAQKPDTRAKIAKLYKPFFEYLRDQYELKSKQQFRRICDPLNP